MDGQDDAAARLAQIAEQQKQQEKEISVRIEEVNDQLLQNNGWETFNAAEIAESSLEGSTTNELNTNDPQSRRFLQFVSLATNLASLPFTKKLNRIPELVETIKKLIEDILKEVKEYGDMANELRNLIHSFTQMVLQTQHNVKMILPLLAAAKTQLSVVHDIMSTDLNQQLNQVDKKDIELSLNRMKEGMDKLLHLSETAKAESQRLDERTHKMTNTVQSKKILVEERVQIARSCMKFGMPVGSITGAFVVGGAIAAEAFGGMGALIIGSVAFPPVTAVVGAAMIGGSLGALAVFLVRKFWESHQLKALGYLNTIYEHLTELDLANINFMEYMNDSNAKASQVSQHLKDIQMCLESERQRRINRDICVRAIDSTGAMIDSLQRIADVDVSNWVSTTTTALSFSTAKRTVLAIKS